ncbi:MAG: serine/threonine-protein phosphatase [Saprospiraceae bacterium]|nr:serine/threonine-protein phosphatase [Saprospiraceae bacterium]
MIRLSGFTDVGKIREHNEDDYRICCDLEQGIWGHSQEERNPLSKSGALMVVADGMGGADAGEIASRLAVEAVKNYFLELILSENATDDAIRDHLKLAFNKALQAISAAIEINPALYKMGTTLTVAWLIPQGMYIAWIGDSRAYLFNKNGRLNLQVDQYKNCSDRLKILTDDHSLVWQEVIKTNGAFSAEQARVSPESNIILRCLSNEYLNDEPDLVGPIKIQNNDRILLCSDGLNGMLPDTKIEELIAEYEDDLDAGNALLDEANQAGGKDNITVLLASIFGPENSQPGVIESTTINFDKTYKKRKTTQKKWLISVTIFLVILGLLFFIICVANKSLHTSSLSFDNAPTPIIGTNKLDAKKDSQTNEILVQKPKTNGNNKNDLNIKNNLSYVVNVNSSKINNDTPSSKLESSIVLPTKLPINLNAIPPNNKDIKVIQEKQYHTIYVEQCKDGRLESCGSATTKVERVKSHNATSNNVYYYNSKDDSNKFKNRTACNEAKINELLQSTNSVELTIEFNLLREPGENCKDAIIINIKKISSEDKRIFK